MQQANHAKQASMLRIIDILIISHSNKRRYGFFFEC